MFPVNDLTVLIVTFKTNHKILDDCIKSIDGKSKIIIVENSNDLGENDSEEGESNHASHYSRWGNYNI